MAGIDATRVLVGAPDQNGTSGAISVAPLGTALPTDAVSELDQDFKAGGYVSNDGVSLSPDMSTNDIIDWDGTVVRTLVESFKGTLKVTFIQLDGDTAKLVYGENNVTVTPANASHGEQIAIAMGAQLPDPASYVIRMKDGKNLIRIVLPNAQPTQWDEITFQKTEAIPLATTLTCYPDGDGKSIYIYTDNGVKAGA